MNHKKTYADALFWASAFFKENGREETAAEYLLCGLLNWSKTDLMMKLRDEMPEAFLSEFKSGVARHVAGEPVQYIFGYEMFYGRKFHVTPEVLIPRPETEELVEGVLSRVDALFQGQQEIRVLDIGTGSGAIAISLALENPSLQVVAADIAETSLDIAAENARSLGAQNISFCQGDLFAALSYEDAKKGFDVIVSNPPYIPSADCLELDEVVKDHEPMRALDGGVTGLDFYRKIVFDSQKYLHEKGLIAFEVGAGQGNAVKDLLEETYPDGKSEVVFDINGKDRMVYMVRKQ